MSSRLLFAARFSRRLWRSSNGAGGARQPPDRARAPGPRHRLLSSAAADALLRPVPRLHGVAPRRGQVRQRRAEGEPGLEALGAGSRHGRDAESRDPSRRGDHAGEARHRGGGAARLGSRRHPIPRRAERPFRPPAYLRDLHGREELPRRRGRARLRPFVRPGPQRRRPPSGVVPDGQRHPGDRLADAGRPDPPRFRESLVPTRSPSS